MSILLYGQKADRTHENKMLRAFIQALKADWAGADKDITLIANSMWDGHEVDLVCILPTAILIVDFKHYSGHLSGTENGPWRVAGAVVQGGSKVNPYQQIRDYKFAIIGWLEKQQLLLGQNLGHINGAVVFTGPITGEANVFTRASYWFHTTDIEHCATTLADLASTELRVYPKDVEAIKEALGVRGIDFDFGQDNYQAAVVPINEEPTKPEQNLSAEPAAIKSIPVAPKQSVLAEELMPPQKSRMPSMFKSAIVAGGVFLTMALVSQIYPTSGQSSTSQSTQPTVQHHQPAPEKASQSTAPAYAEYYIEASSVSQHIGQEVAVCGAVAQATPFSKGVYLNLDKPHPQQSVTLVVWEDALKAVESKLGRFSSLIGVDVCASGLVGEYRSRPQIQINSASAVHLKANYLTTANQQNNEKGVERIEAYRAPFYVGKQVMACGVLAGVSEFSKGMYLSLDKNYPNQTLTLVVWNESIAPLESKFGSFSSKVGRTFCALGTIEKYKKNLQIQIENPQFLRLMLN